MLKRPRIAFVIQRYGTEVGGGAEQMARWLAEHLIALADIEVMTTCALDYRTWENYYPAGDSNLNEVQIHRFLVDTPRDWVRSQKSTFQLLHSEHSLLDEIEWMKQQGPVSTPLIQAIADKKDHYDAFIFFTYSYATTFFGLPIVPEKSLLVPNAHDEPYLKLPLFRPTFHLPQVIIYNTETEKRMVNKVMSNHSPAQIVAGVGINVPSETSAERFRKKFGIEDPFLLFVGRVDKAKNIPELLEYFERYRRNYNDPLKLVLIGNLHLVLPEDPDIIHLGFLSEGDKFDALEAAAVVVIPSLYESLSMIALEAWWMRKAILVNGHCEVLKQQCRRSNGGLYYRTYEEFETTLSLLLSTPNTRNQLGLQGRKFVAENYRWEIIMAKYQAIFEALF